MPPYISNLSIYPPARDLTFMCCYRPPKGFKNPSACIPINRQPSATRSPNARMYRRRGAPGLHGPRGDGRRGGRLPRRRARRLPAPRGLPRPPRPLHRVRMAVCRNPPRPAGEGWRWGSPKARWETPTAPHRPLHSPIDVHGAVMRGEDCPVIPLQGERGVGRNVPQPPASRAGPATGRRTARATADPPPPDLARDPGTPRIRTHPPLHQRTPTQPLPPVCGVLAGRPVTSPSQDHSPSGRPFPRDGFVHTSKCSIVDIFDSYPDTFTPTILAI